MTEASEAKRQIDRSLSHLLSIVVGAVEIFIAQAVFVGMDWLMAKVGGFDTGPLPILQWAASGSFLLSGVVRIVEEVGILLATSRKRIRDAWSN